MGSQCFCIPKLAVDVSYLKHAADDYSRRHFRCIYLAESSNQYRFSFKGQHTFSVDPIQSSLILVKTVDEMVGA